MLRKKALITLAITLWASSAIGALQLISVNDEIALGRQAQQDVRRQVPEVRDQLVASYVASLGRRLAAQADGPRYPYSFDVANLREINAFALPGGPIWIHRGAIEAAQTESQLAGVLAHEIAHIANRHAASQITKGTVANVGLGLLGSLLGGGNGGADRATRRRRRRAVGDDEVQPRRGTRSGSQGAGLHEARRLRSARHGRVPASAARAPGPRSRIRCRPSSRRIRRPAERVSRLQQEANRLAGGRRDSASFQQVQTRLDRLAPARAR